MAELSMSNHITVRVEQEVVDGVASKPKYVVTQKSGVYDLNILTLTDEEAERLVQLLREKLLIEPLV